MGQVGILSLYVLYQRLDNIPLGSTSHVIGDAPTPAATWWRE